jgi:hypothetical protein
MKLFSIVLFPALFVAAISAPQLQAAPCPSQPKTEAALLDLERSWAKAIQQHDADTVSCFLSDEFQDAGVEGELNDRAATLARIPKRGPNQNRLGTPRLTSMATAVRGLNQVLDPSGKPQPAAASPISLLPRRRCRRRSGHETLMPDEKH